MRTNVGRVERVLRTLIGAGLLLVFLASGSLVALALSTIAILTGIGGHCPFYQLAGMSTLPRRGWHH